MKIAELAQAEVDAGRFAGISWHIEHRGSVVSRDAVGFADHALSRPLQTDAIVRIYSMTKPLVSILALMLIEQERLSLSDPVTRYLPFFGKAGVLQADGARAELARPATIEDLLTHRSGLSYDFLPDCTVAAMYREARLLADGSRSLDALAEELSRLPLAKQPGTQWYYSAATDVLAAIVQGISDKPLIDALRERLLDPLGMPDTHFGVGEGSRHRLAEMFGLNPLESENIATDRPQTLEPMQVDVGYPIDQADSFARGGHGLFSSLADYAAFNQFLLTGRDSQGHVLMSPQGLNDAWLNRLSPEQRPICIGDRPFPGYGWGLFGRVMQDVEVGGPHATRGEGGWSGAASTWFWVDRHNEFSGVVFTQYLGAQVHLGEIMQAAAYEAFL